MLAEVRATYLRNLFVASLIAVTSSLTATAGSASPSEKTSPSQKAQLVESYGNLPLSFEANTGQAGPGVKFLSRGNGYGLYLTDDGAVLTLRKRLPAAARSRLQPEVNSAREHARENAESPSSDAVQMQLAGANGRVEISGEDKLPGTANYFIGSDPAKWHANIPTFTKVHYSRIYAGIDLLYYGNQRQLEYDFVVAPRADPRQIRLQFAGAKRLRLSADGNLVLTTMNGALAFRRPSVYQLVHNHRRAVAADFALLPQHTIGFHVGHYDHAKPLVIDPVLVYSTYLGGSLGDQASAITVDTAGNAYITGMTNSVDFPVTTGAFQATNHAPSSGGSNAFVTKLNPTGTALVYSTYLGGSGSLNGSDSASALAVDTSGNAYVTGRTYSSDFPVTSGAFQSTNHAAANGLSNAFVTALNPTGTALVYSTYLGGSGGTDLYGASAGDQGTGLAVDGSGNAYVSGEAVSSDFPVTPGALQTTNPAPSPGQSAFVTKLNPAGGALVYSTYLGPIGDKYGSGGSTSLALDTSGDAYIVGATSFANFPVTPGVFQSTNNAAANSLNNVFVSELNPAGNTLVFSTFLGGSSDGQCCAGDTASSVAVDTSGNVYVTGSAQSADFPVTPGAFQTTNHGAASKYEVPNAFVSKLNSTATALLYSTYLGGSGGMINASPSLGFTAGDQASGLAIDTSGNAYVTGFTASADFPVTPGAYQTISNDQPGCVGGCIGGYNAFITELNSTGNALVYSTFLGGSGINPYDTLGVIVFGSGDQANALALDSSANVYVTGSAQSYDFPVTGGAFQTSVRSPQNAFVAKLNMGGTSTTTTPTLTITPTSTSITSGQMLPVTITVTGGSGGPTPTGEVILASGSYASAATTLTSGGVTVDIPGGSLSGEPYPYNLISPDLLTGKYIPDAASSSTYNFASAFSQVQVLSATEWVTPLLSSVNFSESQSQPIALAIAVTSGSGYPVPTGSVMLTNGSYNSAPAILTGGNATISVPAGTLTTGFNISLLANYSGDANYAAVSQPSMVYVNAGTLVVSVTPSSTSITAAQSLPVTITVSAGSGNPTPSGTVTLFGNNYYSVLGYISAVTPLTTGLATITIPAGSLPSGSDSLQAYFDDANTGSVDAIGLASVTVAPSGPSFTITGTAVSLAPGATTGNSSTITLLPSGGFTGNVALTAVVTSSPSGAQDPPTFSFGLTSPVPITGIASGTATLTISTTAATNVCSSADLQHHRILGNAAAGSLLTCVLLFAVPAGPTKWRSRRKKMLGLLMLLATVTLTGGMLACGSSSPAPVCASGTTPGTYSITVTGTSGATTQQGVITLTVQ
jgi:hypothetical protein